MVARSDKEQLPYEGKTAGRAKTGTKIKASKKVQNSKRKEPEQALNKVMMRSKLNISIPPSNVRLITTSHDPYKWSFVPEKRHLFQKQLSKHYIRAYEEIYTGIDDETFEAIPAEASNAHFQAFTTIAEATPEKISNAQVQKKPVAGFTAKIEDLTSHNLRLMTELEQWRSAALQAEASNRDLTTSLEAAQSAANAIQQENEHLEEISQRNSLAADFFRAKAAQSEAVVHEISDALESAKLKIFTICPDP